MFLETHLGVDVDEGMDDSFQIRGLLWGLRGMEKVLLTSGWLHMKQRLIPITDRGYGTAHPPVLVSLGPRSVPSLIG